MERMEFVVATVLLFCALAGASHVPGHSMDSPRFIEGKTHYYDFTMEMTSNVKGIRPQASKSVTKARVMIYAKTEDKYIMRVDKVKVSGSVPSVPSISSDVTMTPDHHLEKLLNMSIGFSIGIDGKVKHYVMDNSHESILSEKIKRTILRSLEMYVPEHVVKALKAKSEDHFPYTYHVTQKSRTVNYVSKYTIMVSPNPEFPRDRNVYNITQEDHYESHRYDGHMYFHNFQKQGCPEICTKNSTTNAYEAGCPVGYEPYESPIKMSYTHHHHLDLVEGKAMVPEIIETKETHVARMYDQDMEVLLRVHMRRKKIESVTLTDPSSSELHSDLDDLNKEIMEHEIAEYCHYEDNNKAVEVAKKMLTEITGIILRGNLDDPRSSDLGEKVYLLQQSLRLLKKEDFEKVELDIVKLPSVIHSSDEEKVKRQVWIEVLPLVGTSDSVSYIADYIKSGLPDNIEVFEATEIMTALPWNIMKPNRYILRRLTELMDLPVVRKNHILYSATYLTVAKVISRLCTPHHLSLLTKQQSSWFSNYRNAFESQQQTPSKSECPLEEVKKVVENIENQLRESESKPEIAVCIDTLAQIGIPQVLSVLKEYAHGSPDNLKAYSPRYIDFVKTLTLYSLHNMVGSYPDKILDIVGPIYFNKTEPPKVRIAAFSTLIRCNPSLDDLKHVVQDTWSEPSIEVRSYVTTALETFGNSTLPCHQITATRIKKVISEAKLFHTGKQNSKNFQFNYYDILRDFSMERRWEYGTNNESFIPRTLYAAYYYTTKSLRDVLFQTAINMEGITQYGIRRILYNWFGMVQAKDIPKVTEQMLFGDMTFVARMSEEWRATLFQRFFYSSFYNYLDQETSEDTFTPVKKHWKNFYNYGKHHIKGYWVKIFLPSSHHTASISKVIPYPVEFEMKNAIVIAVKIDTPAPTPPTNYKFGLRPSVHISKLYTNKVNNLGDCKEVGTYHELKLAYSHEFEITLENNFPEKLKITYGVKNPKKTKVLTYHAECGTYAGKYSLDRLPSKEERMPIKTIPSPFEHNKCFPLIGLPMICAEFQTEDISYKTKVLKAGAKDMFHLYVTSILNAGWRQTSMNLTLEPKDFGQVVTFLMNVKKDYVIKEVTKDEDTPENWAEKLNFDDEKLSRNSTDYIIKAREVHSGLVDKLSHVSYQFNLTISTTPVSEAKWFKLYLEHIHTFEPSLYYLNVHTDSKLDEQEPIKLRIENYFVQLRRPDEFKYDLETYGKQRARFLTFLSWKQNETCSCVDGLMWGRLKYKNLAEIINPELAHPVDIDYYYPEDHKECLKNVREGRPQSVECIRTTRDHGIYNHLSLHFLWWKDMPESVVRVLRAMEHWMVLLYYGDVKIPPAVWKATAPVNSSFFNYIHLTTQYIDRMTDRPVIDVTLERPGQPISSHRVDVNLYPPFSSLYSPKDVYLYRHTNNTYPVTCSLMENYIRTFDMKTYPLINHNCEYLVASHCTSDKKFAITARGEGNRKNINIFIGELKISHLIKAGNVYTFLVSINGKKDEKHIVIVNKPVLLDKEEHVYAYLVETSGKKTTLEIRADRAGISIKYDVTNLNLRVSPMYKGELCGLCSEFDGEVTLEFIGPDRCLYSKDKHFISSSLLHPDDCPSYVPASSKEKRCDNADDVHGNDESEPRMKRNIIIPREDEICFSILPYSACERNTEPRVTEKIEVGFHCLPKRDITAKRLVTEAKRRVLGEIEGKSVDFTDVMEVPKSC